MKTFKLAIRAFYAVVSIASIIAYSYLVFNLIQKSGAAEAPAPNFTRDFLILHLATFIISLPSLIKTLIFIGKTTGKPMLAVAFFGIGLIVAPLTLVTSTVITVVRLVRDMAPKGLTPEALESTSREIFLVSQDMAARSLLDDTADGDITVDDGETVHTFRRIALIEDRGESYALLSPILEEGNVAHAYRIVLGENELYSLDEVTDKIVYTRIYDKYRRLLEKNAG